ncbi:hypothetical protein AV530_001202 [Patagioenas fasciata monilis]|uniref:Uncharacterized protein n=1 Tax=Patagioenas fasciata monilis TaxID=372326 RepID=A0A1V4KTW6_PATFA|nr:hypothetical protein AV530_001202 [Patagioenas fasciata monilis]
MHCNHHIVFLKCPIEITTISSFSNNSLTNHSFLQYAALTHLHGRLKEAVRALVHQNTAVSAVLVPGSP